MEEEPALSDPWSSEVTRQDTAVGEELFQHGRAIVGVDESGANRGLVMWRQGRPPAEPAGSRANHAT